MSLRRRLLTMVFVVLGLCLVAGSALTYWHSVRKVDIEMISAEEVGVSALRDALLAAHDPTSDARLQIRRVLSAFDGDRHLKVRLVSPTGDILERSRVPPPADPAPEWLFALLAGERSPRVIELPPHMRALGHIEVEAQPANEISEVWEDAKLKLLIIGGFCALVLALTYATLGSALRPLETLSAALARVGKGDYRVQVDETGPHELTIIYKAFNNMAQELDRSERQNRRLAEQLSTVQEEERAEIARDLHDEIGPFLFAVDVDAQTIPPLMDKGARDEVLARGKSIRQSVTHMQKHLRNVLSRLRPALMLDLGLTHAVDQLVAFWQGRRPAIEFTTDIDEQRLPPNIEEAAFRILQEGTSNAIRHGEPAHIALTARIGDSGRLRISVSDDGSGLVSSASGGFGLKGMRERVRLLGGTLSLQPGVTGSGVLLTAELPLPESARPAPLSAAKQEEAIEAVRPL